MVSEIEIEEIKDAIISNKNYLLHEDVKISQQKEIVAKWLNLVEKIKVFLTLDIQEFLFGSVENADSMACKAISLEKELSCISVVAPGLFNKKLSQEFNYSSHSNQNYDILIALIQKLKSMDNRNRKDRTDILKLSHQLFFNLIEKENHVAHTFRFL